MSSVEIIEVSADDSGVRLDKWFKNRFPTLGHGKLQKLLRTGQVRVDGGRVKSGTRLVTGQQIRVPPLGDNLPKQAPVATIHRLSDADREEIQDSIIHIDDEIIAINKPQGLAVQGGSGTTRHVDGMLDALRYGYPDRPRLVHRLDKDTSGVLVIARDVQTARRLNQQFRTRDVRKLYWALVVGVPAPEDGLIDLRLTKAPGRGGERMMVDELNGKRSQTRYRVLDNAGKQASWLALEPLTGRTHQLRVHLADALQTPIVGDGKYGASHAFIEGGGVGRNMHLHARRIRLLQGNGDEMEISAPIPDHIKESFDYLGFFQEADYDLFLELE